MTRGIFWQILRGAGFYRRKFLVFLVAAIVLGGGFWLWQKRGAAEASLDIPKANNNSSSLNYEVQVTSGAEVFVNGKKENAALKFYDDYDEMRLIVVKEPGYYINDVHATVHLPNEPQGEIKPIIYAVHGVSYSNFEIIDSQTIAFDASDISPQAVLTIVVDFPKGLVTPPFSERLVLSVQKFPLHSWLVIAVVLPLATMAVLLFMLIKRRAASFFKLGPPLQSPPTQEAPAICGVLVEGTVGAREIAATLVDLARRKLLIIVKGSSGDFCFGKRGEVDFMRNPRLAPFEKALLSKIFLAPAYKSSLNDVEMRVGRHIFSRRIAQFYLGVYNTATLKGYFVQNPAKVHLAYKYTGVILFFLSFFGFVLGALTGADPKFGLFFWIGGMAAASVIIKLSPFMPARSALGTAEVKKWLAFREFMTEKKISSASEVLNNKFIEYLPFAIVMGCEVEWANHFAREPFTKPDWYESAEQSLTLESFVGQFFPFIGYVAENLARSHEPTIE